MIHHVRWSGGNCRGGGGGVWNCYSGKLCNLWLFYRHSSEYRCQLGVGGDWLVWTMGWTNILVSSLILVGVGVLFTTKPFSNHAEKLVDKVHQVIAQLSGSARPQGRSGATRSGERLFTKEEMKDYDGRTRSEIYIALVGSVYDVTKGERFYAAGNHYGGFSGKHALGSVTFSLRFIAAPNFSPNFATCGSVWTTDTQTRTSESFVSEKNKSQNRRILWFLI